MVPSNTSTLLPASFVPERTRLVSSVVSPDVKAPATLPTLSVAVPKFAVGGDVSIRTLVVPPAGPKLPAVSMILAERDFVPLTVGPPLLQPDNESIIKVTVPLAIFDSVSTERTGVANGKVSIKSSTISPTDALVPVRSTSTATPAAISAAFKPLVEAETLNKFIGAPGISESLVRVTDIGDDEGVDETVLPFASSNTAAVVAAYKTS